MIISGSDLEDDVDECPLLGDTIILLIHLGFQGRVRLLVRSASKRGKVVTIPDIAFVTYVGRGNLVNILLTAVVDSKLSWYRVGRDRFRTIWISGDSIAGHRAQKSIDPSVPKIHLSVYR